MARSLTVTYRKFDHLYDFTTTQLKRLRKLSYGDNGCMAPVIDFHNGGYVVDEYGEPISEASACRYGADYNFSIDFKELELNRHIMVAYIGKTMVGWAVTDLDDMFNVYVEKKYRNLGIAQKLTELWADRNKTLLKKIASRKVNSWNDPVYDVVHTDETAKLMNNAMRKLNIQRTNKKYKRIVHKVLG